MPSLSEAHAARPNIIFILLDDVRWDDFDGQSFVDLPNIQRLRKEAVSFNNAFVTTPLCSPSRASFLTGQYAFAHGILDNRERKEESHRLITFPRLLHDAGYNTAFIGKWHMSDEDDSRRPGFDHWVSFPGQGTYFNPDINVNGERTRHTGYTSDILNQYAVDFIRRPHDRPFLVYLSHKAVHPEIHAGMDRSFPPAPRHANRYGQPRIQRRPNAAAGFRGKPALQQIPDPGDPRSPKGGLPDEDILGRLRMLSAIDDGLGEIVRVMEQTGKLNETVIVLTSDQGFFYGEFGLAQERRLAYEESIRIPLLVRYPPRTRVGHRPEQMALNIDIAPTLLELAGIPVPEWMQGRSLATLLAGEAPDGWRESFLIEYHTDAVFPRIHNMGYNALRTRRMKYIQYRELEAMDELYDLAEDPYEMVNLFGRPGTEEGVRRLREELEDILRRKIH